MNTHTLKIWPENFDAIESGACTAEVRIDDGRNFEVGDRLHLDEWDNEKQAYSGRVVLVIVTHVKNVDSRWIRGQVDPRLRVLSVQLENPADESTWPFDEAPVAEKVPA